MPWGGMQDPHRRGNGWCEIGRARLAEILSRKDKRREPDDPETENAGVRRRIERGASYLSEHRAAYVESVPVAMPIDVPAVVEVEMT